MQPAQLDAAYRVPLARLAMRPVAQPVQSDAAYQARSTQLVTWRVPPDAVSPMPPAVLSMRPVMRPARLVAAYREQQVRLAMLPAVRQVPWVAESLVPLTRPAMPLARSAVAYLVPPVRQQALLVGVSMRPVTLPVVPGALWLVPLQGPWPLQVPLLPVRRAAQNAASIRLETSLAVPLMMQSPLVVIAVAAVPAKRYPAHLRRHSRARAVAAVCSGKFCCWYCWPLQPGICTRSLSPARLTRSSQLQLLPRRLSPVPVVISRVRSADSSARPLKH
jgi:hypothetical protein